MTDHGKVVRLLRVGPGKGVLEHGDEKTHVLNKRLDDGRPHVRLEDRQARDQHALRRVLLHQVKACDSPPARSAAMGQKPPQPRTSAPLLIRSTGHNDLEP